MKPVFLALALLLGAGTAAAADDLSGGETRTARFLQGIENDPLRLHAFLAEMPKGGDLHNHLDGAVYAETFLAHAEAAGLCIDVAARAIRPAPCKPPLQPARDALAIPGLHDLMVDSLSMRDYVPTPDDRSGHDHFFGTFGKFAPAADDRGAMLAEEAHRAAAEHTSYLEIMTMPMLRQVTALGLASPWHDTDFAADLGALEPKLPALLSDARQEMDKEDARMRAVLGCGTPQADAGCAVTLRYQAFALRAMPPAAVFAQIALGFALAGSDPRFVGVNIVQPEDDPVALRDYRLHMAMLRFFHERAPSVRLSLHAGELAAGLVPPEALRFHIREAVEVAGASRIGHGVDIMFEDRPDALLAEMASKGIAVEINQTSNDQILGVRGPHHPFADYRAAGVPVVLSTDDEGVERIDLTHEYVRAVETWHLGYRDLKALARASIRYSFLPGAPLRTATDGAPRPPSDAELAASAKARLQWQLERQFAAFEQEMAGAAAHGH